MHIAAWILLLIPFCVMAQSGQDSSVPVKELSRVSKEYNQYANEVSSNTDAALLRMQRLESKMQQKLAKKDTTAAKRIFSNASDTYRRLKQVTTDSLHPLKEYLPGLDSVQTALRYWQSRIPSAGVLPTQGQLLTLESRLQQANTVSDFLTTRQTQLQSALSGYGMGKELAAYQQQAYYYQAQVQQYKALLHDPDKLASKLLSVVRDVPSFQKFFQQNSYISTLFRLPGSGSPDLSGAPLPGLPLRSDVAALVAQRLGPGANFASAVSGVDNGGGNPLSTGIGDAKGAMDDWKDKITGAGGSSSSEPMPAYTPNTEHNKTFFRRLELGFSVQTSGGTTYLPSTSDFALTIGYKASDKVVFGVGGAYRMGLGHPFNEVSLSGQGANLRSYLDARWKGTWWISGGLEYNYYNALNGLTQFPSFQAWQASGLVGLTKKLTVRGKTSSAQLLYDWLHAAHIPRSQPVIFRVGYTL